ncbi:Retrovirus-related Pol polyprotein from transposon RE1 [Vitis vinifera]|uniref:Retrovirus-related Pol polyprotein from transposon RE1 n=1 Tax=Vitis vinifera TaxID=29760 RepID=A0A438I746_VITVI|nr:Retrovirus-related Pol polyprotein from transposon RE1 [Vitis vinifera]
MSWLYASLPEDIMAQIVGYSIAVEIWNALNQIYSTSSMVQVTELHTKLQTLKKDGLSASEYIQRLKSICNSLTAIGEPVFEKSHLIYLFNGLDQFSYPAMAHPAGMHNTVPDTNWYMDSGATHHFTLDINMLDTVAPFSGSDWVIIGIGKQLCISHLGTAKLPSLYSPLVLHQPYAFQTATYLINRLPIPMLHHQSPYFTLYHKLLAYTHLKNLKSSLSQSISSSFSLSVPLSIPLPPLFPSPPMSPSIPPPSPPSPSVDLPVPCSLTEPTSFCQAIKDPSWKQTMELEFAALQHNKTYPVVKPHTIRIVFSLALSQNWCIRQLDVHNAFLHGDLAEDVFMEQLLRYFDPLYPTHVCKLDNGSHSPQVTHLIQQLHHQFSLKDLGHLHHFLGLEVHHTPTGIHFSQAKYITDLLTRAAMLDAKPCPTPMSSNTNLSLHDGVALENGSDYRSFVGALHLLKTTTSLAIQMPTRLPALMTGVAPVATASSLALIWFLGHLPNKKWSLAPAPNQSTEGPLSTQCFITLRSKLTVLTRPMSLRGDVKLKDVIS